MINIALGIGGVLILGYQVFPRAQSWIGAAAPFLLLLACPLAMYLMMKGMNRRPDQGKSPGQRGGAEQKTGSDDDDTAR